MRRFRCEIPWAPLLRTRAVRTSAALDDDERCRRRRRRFVLQGRMRWGFFLFLCNESGAVQRTATGFFGVSLNDTERRQ